MFDCLKRYFNFNNSSKLTDTVLLNGLLPNEPERRLSETAGNLVPLAEAAAAPEVFVDAEAAVVALEVSIGGHGISSFSFTT